MSNQLNNAKQKLFTWLKLNNIPDFYYVVTDFETTTEKKCGKMDSKNRKRYDDLLQRATKAQKSIGNTGLNMSLEVPPPPTPNNRDRYNLWKRRNATQKVIPQAEAVFFLTKQGYELNKDYEAYQAVGLASQIMKEKGIQKSQEDISKDFSNVYSENDSNMLRRYSIYGMNEYRKARNNIITQHYNESNTNNSEITLSSFSGVRTQSLPNIPRASVDLTGNKSNNPNNPNNTCTSNEINIQEASAPPCSLKTPQHSLYPSCDM